MQTIKLFISEHKKAALIGLFLCIVFIGGSAVSAIHVSQIRAQNASPAVADGSQEKKPASAASSATSGATEVALTESQTAAIDQYDDETKKFIASLSSSVWAADGGRDTIRFSNTQFEETSNGKTVTHSYAVTRLDKHMDTSGAQVYTVAFETDDGTHIVTCTDFTGNRATGKSQIASTLSSSTMFLLKDTNYERTHAVEAITIKGLNSEMTKLLGGNTNALIDSLSAWCAKYFPTATEASWDSIAVLNYDKGTVSTNFTLNTQTPTTVAATYHTDTGTFDFDF